MESVRKMSHNDAFNLDFGQLFVFGQFVLGECALFTCICCRLWANSELIQKVEAQNLVLKELRYGNSFKRCAIVDIVPMGSYQATLKRVGLYGISYEGVPFRTFVLSCFSLQRV